ncbi:MAG TPA: hypothetical protein VF715_11950 [Thermoleophilaceae bacterium]
MPHLLRERPVGLQVVLAGLVPALFGAVTGWALGVNEIAYLVLSVLGIAGGYMAGLEHDGAGQGALRGVVGGALFGGFILLTHNAIGGEAEAELPHPEILLVAITTAFGVGLGALGGRRRHRHEVEGPKDKEEKKRVDFKRLHWAEFIGFAGSAVLLFSLFLPWFSTSCDSVGPARPEGCNPNSNYGGRFGDFNAFETYNIMDIALVLACIAPFVLAYLVVRQAQLSWRPGEVTMIIGMVAAALILMNGIVLGRPGESVEISIKFGYVIGLIGASMILVGGALRQALGGRTRKPPGVL